MSYFWILSFLEWLFKMLLSSVIVRWGEMCVWSGVNLRSFFLMWSSLRDWLTDLPFRHYRFCLNLIVKWDLSKVIFLLIFIRFCVWCYALFFLVLFGELSSKLQLVRSHLVGLITRQVVVEVHTLLIVVFYIFCFLYSTFLELLHADHLAFQLLQSVLYLLFRDSTVGDIRLCHTLAGSSLTKCSPLSAVVRMITLLIRVSLNQAWLVSWRFELPGDVLIDYEVFTSSKYKSVVDLI